MNFGLQNRSVRPRPRPLCGPVRVSKLESHARRTACTSINSTYYSDASHAEHANVHFHRCATRTRMCVSFPCHPHDPNTPLPHPLPAGAPRHSHPIANSGGRRCAACVFAVLLGLSASTPFDSHSLWLAHPNMQCVSGNFGLNAAHPTDNVQPVISPPPRRSAGRSGSSHRFQPVQRPRSSTTIIITVRFSRRIIAFGDITERLCASVSDLAGPANVRGFLLVVRVG